MKKTLLCLAIATATLCFVERTNAQMPYHVSVLQETYTPLSTTATDITNGQAWSDTATFTFPVGFSFQLAGNTINTISIQEANLIMASASGVQSGFAILGTALQDRNFLPGNGKSPVRYQTTGAAGSRIFKMEIRNAGFSNERSLYNTNNDSVSLQLWIYENNSTFEFRFGNSFITHFNDYFPGKVPLGYMKDLDLNDYSFDRFYGLKGDPTNPGMDTLTNLNNISGLDSYPVSGTVYRFLLKSAPTGISTPEKVTLGKLFPVPAKDVLIIESAADRFELLSVTGKVLSTGILQQGKTTVPVQHLAAGMYLVRLSDRKGQSDTQKFIKQ